MAKLGTSPLTLSNVVAYETAPEHGFCREGVTVNVASATSLVVGSVLGKITASGKYVPRNPAGSDGSQVAAAVVLENIDVAATTDTEVTVVVRGPFIVKQKGLVFNVTHNSTQQAAAIAELNAIEGIVVR